MPMESNAYYFRKPMIIWCVPMTNDTLIILNSTEYISPHSSLAIIGGPLNKSNKTICAYCINELYETPITCFTMICKFIMFFQNAFY